MFAEVIAFNVMIGNQVKDKPTLLAEKEVDWLYAALQEEAEEFLDANEFLPESEREEGDPAQPSIVNSVDALLDSIYFAIGGLHRMGLTAEQMQACFTAIHEANMGKKRGVVDKRPNDGTVSDAVKPVGFKDPAARIREILGAS